MRNCFTASREGYTSHPPLSSCTYLQNELNRNSPTLLLWFCTQAQSSKWFSLMLRKVPSCSPLKPTFQDNVTKLKYTNRLNRVLKKSFMQPKLKNQPEVHYLNVKNGPSGFVRHFLRRVRLQVLTQWWFFQVFKQCADKHISEVLPSLYAECWASSRGDWASSRMNSLKNLRGWMYSDPVLKWKWPIHQCKNAPL